MYRSQVYQDTSRVAGPYLPPYPLQGVGSLQGLSGTCDDQQRALAAAQALVDSQNQLINTYAGQAAAMSEEDAANFRSGAIIPATSALDNMVQARNSAQAEYDSCVSRSSQNLYVTPVSSKCPIPGQYWDEASQLCINPGLGPSKNQPTPAVVPSTPVAPTPAPPAPTPAATSSNTWLWIGLAAAVGVGGIIIYKRSTRK